MRLLPSLWLAGVLLASSASSAEPALPNQTDIDLWQRVGQAMTSVQQMRYTLVKQERLFPDDASMAPQETFLVKFRKPYDIYFDVINGPNNGRHYLYRQGWPYLKVHVFGRALQWLVPKIPPISSLALNGNHHAITDAGYDNTVNLVKESLYRSLHEYEKNPSAAVIQIDPVKEVVDDGVPSYYYRSVNPEIFRNYTVTASDKTVFDIASKVGCHPYLLIYYNANKVRKYDDIRAGEQLRYPLYYGKVTEFWVDKSSLLLRHIRVTDFFNKLYEEYEYKDIYTDASAGLTDRDFDPSNPEYGGF